LRASRPWGRGLEVRITPAGLELLERAQAAAKTVEDRTLALLTPEQQRELRAILRQMMIVMDIYLPDSADVQ
jgi:DNA-binding MarR family transcriptional regulator